MKKLILALSILFVSCQERSIEVIDGCQYIKTTSIGDGTIVETLEHKGNCNNPIHQSKRDTIKILKPEVNIDSLKAIDISKLK